MTVLSVLENEHRLPSQLCISCPSPHFSSHSTQTLSLQRINTPIPLQRNVCSHETDTVIWPEAGRHSGQVLTYLPSRQNLSQGQRVTVCIPVCFLLTTSLLPLFHHLLPVLKQTFENNLPCAAHRPDHISYIYRVKPVSDLRGYSNRIRVSHNLLFHCLLVYHS